MKKMLLLGCLLVFLVGCAKGEPTITDYQSVEVGTKQEKVHKRFGEPDSTLSGLYGDIYVVEDKQVIIYYDFNEETGYPVTEIKTFDIVE